jgi:hypothetical protein
MTYTVVIGAILKGIMGKMAICNVQNFIGSARKSKKTISGKRNSSMGPK